MGAQTSKTIRVITPATFRSEAMTIINQYEEPDERLRLFMVGIEAGQSRFGKPALKEFYEQGVTLPVIEDPGLATPKAEWQLSGMEARLSNDKTKPDTFFERRVLDEAMSQ